MSHIQFVPGIGLAHVCYGDRIGIGDAVNGPYAPRPRRKHRVSAIRLYRRGVTVITRFV